MTSQRQHKENAQARMAEANKLQRAEIERQQLENFMRAEKRSEEVEALAKTQARQIWIGEGGASGDFENKWDALYKDMIYQKTLNRMAAVKERVVKL